MKKKLLLFAISMFALSIASGSLRNPAIWSKGLVPGICDSIVIGTGHSLTVDTSVACRAIRISNGATLSINTADVTVNIGQTDDGTGFLDNYGTLAITNGARIVRGRVKLNAAATFNMSGGKLSIDGNTGFKQTAVPEGMYLFEAVAGMASFSFTGGTFEIVDPPFGATGQVINCPYNFGSNSILSLGNGISTTISSNPNGFGGTLFPSSIGKLVINGTVKTGNRQFVITKSLTVRGSCDIKAGSGIIIKAPLKVIQ